MLSTDEWSTLRQAIQTDPSARPALIARALAVLDRVQADEDAWAKELYRCEAEDERFRRMSDGERRQELKRLGLPDPEGDRELKIAMKWVIPYADLLAENNRLKLALLTGAKPCGEPH